MVYRRTAIIFPARKRLCTHVVVTYIPVYKLYNNLDGI